MLSVLAFPFLAGGPFGMVAGVGLLAIFGSIVVYAQKNKIQMYRERAIFLINERLIENPKADDDDLSVYINNKWIDFELIKCGRCSQDEADYALGMGRSFNT